MSGACYSGKTRFAMEQPPLDHRMTRRMLFRLNAVGYGICTAFKDMYLHISSHHSQFYRLWPWGIGIFAVFFFAMLMR